MKKFVWMVLFMFAGCSLIKAQQEITDYNNHYISGETFRYYYQQIQGKPFFTDEWVQGSLQLVTGEWYNHLLLNFDIHKDDLLYYHLKLKRIILVDKAAIKEFRFLDPMSGNELKVVHLNIADTSMVSPGFYFELVNDSVSLYMKKHKAIEHYNSSMTSTKKIGLFYEETTYYFLFNGKYVRVPMRKRKLAKLFPEYSSQIIFCISSNKYSLNKREDLTKLFVEINRFLKNP